MEIRGLITHKDDSVDERSQREATVTCKTLIHAESPRQKLQSANVIAVRTHVCRLVGRRCAGCGSHALLCPTSDPAQRGHPVALYNTCFISAPRYAQL